MYKMKVSKSKTVNFGKVTVVITIEKGTITIPRYFDGYEMGDETTLVDNFKIDFNGQATATTRPTLITEKSFGYSKKMENGAVYECEGSRVAFKKESGQVVLQAIKELEKEVHQAMPEETKAQIESIQQEIAESEARDKAALEAEAEQYQKNIKSGMCPKCGTWCYGDCEAN